MITNKLKMGFIGLAALVTSGCFIPEKARTEIVGVPVLNLRGKVVKGYKNIFYQRHWYEMRNRCPGYLPVNECVPKPIVTLTYPF